MAEMDSVVLRYIHPAHMTPMQCAYDLHTKSRKVADVISRSSLNKIFTESVDPSIFYSFREYWATHTQAEVTDIAFKSQSLLAIQKRGNRTGQ